MSNIIQISDFKGFYEIVNNSFEEDYLQSFIDKYEDFYLTQLLGEDLKALFIADLVAGIPVNADYLKIYNPFSIVKGYCNETITSEGLKSVLLGLVYYHYVHNFTYKQSLTGVVVNKNENSSMLSPANTERVAEIRYNDSVPSYNAINYRLKDLDLYEYGKYITVKTLFV